MVDLFSCTGELVTDLALRDINPFLRRNLEPFRDEFSEVPYPASSLLRLRASPDASEIGRFVILRARCG